MRSIHVLALVVTSACAERISSTPTYDTEIGPLLLANCARCHEPSSVQSTIPRTGSVPTSFRLDQLDSTGTCLPVDAGVDGAPCVLGVTEMAERIVVRAADEGSMPPAGPLPEAQRELLRRWARAGWP